MLKQSRREQHRLTADWLVVRSGDRASEYFGLIAEHYERAGDVVHAVDYLRRAGEDAARSYVNAAALDYLGRALALYAADDAATRFALLETRRAIYSNTGRRDEQAQDVTALEQVAEQLDDDAFRARAAGMRAALALLVGDYRRRRRGSGARRRAGPSRRGRARRGAVGADQLGACAAVPGRLRRRAGEDRAVARARARARRPQGRERGARPARHPGDAARPLRRRPRTTTSRRSTSLARSATARSRAA